MRFEGTIVWTRDELDTYAITTTGRGGCGRPVAVVWDMVDVPSSTLACSFAKGAPPQAVVDFFVSPACFAFVMAGDTVGNGNVTLLPGNGKAPVTREWEALPSGIVRFYPQAKCEAIENLFCRLGMSGHGLLENTTESV